MGKLLRIMLLAIFPVMATGGQAAGQILVLEAEEPVNEIEKQTRNISALIELRKANSPILRGAQGIIVIEVVTNGQAASAGIMVHDVIVTYDEMPINSVAQLVSLIQSNKSGARLVSIGIVRDGQSRSLSLRTGPLGVKIIDVDAAAFQKNQASMQELQQNIQLLEQKIAGANGAPSGLNPSQKIAAIFDPNEPKRPVIPGPACTKCKFEQIPVYWVAKDGKKTIAGHYTGMTRKKIPQGWGRLKLNNGVTIIGTFNAGQPNALTRIVYRNGDRSYLALTSGICGVSSPKLQYKKGQSMIKGRCAPYYKVAGLTYSQNLVALGDHPVNRIASMMIIAGFRPWKLQTVRNESRNSDGWRYAMYTIDTKAFELSYGNAATRKQGERKFLNGRSWSRDRAVRLEYGGGYFRSTPTDPSERNYISPLGAKLGKIQGAWIEDEIPGAVVHRFRNNYPEFSGISPEPHVVNFSDGRRFQGETVDLVPEGFGYELSPDGTQTWGHYHNGRLHGEAVTIKTDGSRQHATYTNGQLDGVVIHSSGSRPPRLDIKTTPSTSLEAPFDLVAGMADQYDAMLTSNKKGAKRFAKEIEKNSPFRGLPINGSFFAQDRSFLAKGWESFYQPPNRSVTDETIEAVRAALAKDQLLGQYVAIGDWYYEAWPSELTLGPQSSYRIEFWRNGVKTGDSDISGWTRCNIANQGAAFFDERARKYTSWADNIHEMTKDYANWWVPASICKGGSADGEGIAISDGGRWIISNGVFSSGRLVSGRRHSFSFNNSGYVGPVSNGMANGWGYQRDELELNQRYKKKMNRYYRGEFKDGEFDGQGSLFYNGEVIRGTFAKGLLDGPVIKLRDQRREDLIYRAGIKTGPMSKVAIQYFVGGQQLVRTTGSYDDQGQFDGPYKETRDDGFVLFEGSMLRGGRTGIQSSIVEMPYRYDFSRAKNLWGIGDDGALLSAELIDPELSSASKFRTLRTTLENGRAVSG